MKQSNKAFGFITSVVSWLCCLSVYEENTYNESLPLQIMSSIKRSCFASFPYRENLDQRVQEDHLDQKVNRWACITISLHSIRHTTLLHQWCCVTIFKQRLSLMKDLLRIPPIFARSVFSSLNTQAVPYTVVERQ